MSQYALLTCWGLLVCQLPPRREVQLIDTHVLWKGEFTTLVTVRIVKVKNVFAVQGEDQEASCGSVP